MQFEDTAPCKQRFRAPGILWTQMAIASPDRGMAVTILNGAFKRSKRILNYTLLWPLSLASLVFLTKEGPTA